MIALHPILTGVSVGLFVSAFGVSAGVIVVSLAPQWDRICRLALGHVEPAFEPLHARPFAKAIRL